MGHIKYQKEMLNKQRNKPRTRLQALIQSDRHQVVKGLKVCARMIATDAMLHEIIPSQAVSKGSL